MSPNKTPVEPKTAEALLSWLDDFPVAALDKRLTALLLQRRELDVEIRFLQAQLMRHRQYLEDLRPGAAGRERPTPASDASGAQPKTQTPPKRLAALRLLSEAPGRAWRLAEIRQALIDRGWLEDNDRARHALQVTLLAMAKRGELQKPRTGFYQMPTDVAKPERTDESGEPPTQAEREL
jgi:hypothetical protein